MGTLSNCREKLNMIIQRTLNINYFENIPNNRCLIKQKLLILRLLYLN
jgi:hypothetical protein